MRSNFLLFLLLICVVNLQAQNERLTPEKLWSLGRVSLFDVAPDESRVLYGVTYYDVAENSGQTDLYTISTTGGDRGNALQLTETPESEGNALYRPDGKKIGFLRNGALWEMNLDGSDPQQVSEIQMNGFKYSPDGRYILYIQDVVYGNTVQTQYPDLPKADARIIDDLLYRHWSSWEDEKRSNVFYAEYADGKLKGKPVNIMKEAFDSPTKPFGGMEEIDWAPNSKYIAYTCKKSSGAEAATSTNTDIYLYNLSTKTTRNLSEGMEGYDREPVFSPTGRYLAWNSMETPGFEADKNRIFIYDLNTNTKWDMTEGLDMNTNHPKWDLTDDKIFFNVPFKGTHQIFQVDFSNNGRLRQMTNAHYDYYDFKVLSDRLIVRRASMSEPHEIFRVSKETSKPLALTMVNKEALANIEMGNVQKRVMNTSDGKQMLTWVIYPPNFDPSKKYPTLLYCQGGPQSTVSQFWSYRWNFQMMAANDYIIVAPNRRGLPSFGQEWNDAISGDWGGQAMTDLLTAIDEMKEEPFVDSTRLGAIGASFGGYSVYWLAGNHQKRFKTFISHCGVFNLESWYGTTEELFFANHDMEGAYWEEETPRSYLRDSPHKYVQNWDTPMLVIHGEKDFRVPVGEGMQAFQAAQLQGIPSRFLYFPYGRALGFDTSKRYPLATRIL